MPPIQHLNHSTFSERNAGLRCPSTLLYARMLNFRAMRVAASSLVLLLLIGCYRDGRSVVIIAAHDISSQTVIQDSDVETVNASNVFKTYASIPAHTVRDRRD